ncbi:MAG: molybdate ABC transporter substrate-binding protein [Rhodospirillum sp.]|nr:molybdate ABC transporter substrate-binding protein [Rhodospirillum sp.]MCF8491248.1 molybdate ABC transporter substrate-binding protein [Rhodospirillum sp.]MCF8500776.1 molybdate ABC transporter substrate-binding protein [Rhodospirillum sp.]
MGRFLRCLGLAGAVLLFGRLAMVPVLAGDLYVYSGAGLRPAVQPLVTLFQKETGQVVLVEYGGMGQMLTRHDATGRGDVFVSGTAFYTDKLAGRGEITDVVPLALHTAVIGLRKENADKITTFADLAKPGLRLALGDPKAMALGRTAEAILDASGLGEAIRANVVARGTTQQQVALYVLNGDVDAGILGRSSVFQAADKLVMVDIPTEYYTPEEVTAGVLKTTTDAGTAKAFVDLLASPRGLAAFADAGFLAVPAN